MLKAIRLKYSEVSQISTENVEGFLEENKVKCNRVVLIDARSLEEHSVSHIKNSFHVPDDISDANLEAFLLQNTRNLEQKEEDVRIVCYCSVGYRSSDMARRISKLMQPDNKVIGIHNMEGSLFKWANENRPMVTPSGEPTVYVHPFNALFGAVLRADLRKYKAEDRNDLGD